MNQRYEDARPTSTSWIEEDEAWNDSVGNLDYPGNFTLRAEDGRSEHYNGEGRILWQRDARGVGYTFTYALNPSGVGLGALQKVVHTSGRQISMTFASGRFLSVTDPAGKVYAYGYDGNRLASVTYPDGLGVKTYHYEDATHPNAVTGYSINGERRTRYAYMADGRVQWSGREGGVERDAFAYGPDWTDVTNAAGHTTRYQFTHVSGTKQVSRTTQPASNACPGGSAVIDYGSNGYVSRKVDFEGNQSFYIWNDRGHLLEERVGVGPAPGNSTAQQQRTTFEWDVARNLLLKKSSYGNSGSIQSEVVYTWHPDSQPTHARLLQKVETCAPTCASGAVRTTQHTYVVRPSRMIESWTVDGPLAGNGDAVTRHYDPAGNLTSVVNGLGHAYGHSDYNGLGLPGRSTEPNGLVTEYTWDAKGRASRTRQVGPWGNRDWTTTWRVDDQPASTVDAAGTTRTFHYDTLGRLVETRAPAGTAYGANPLDHVRLAYDIMSNVTLRQSGYSADGVAFTVTRQRQFAYDQAGHLERDWGVGGSENWYQYDANGRLAGTSDGLGRTSTTLYDTLGRPKTRFDAASQQTQLAYDVLGRLSGVIDPKGNTTGYVYNGFGDLVSQSSPDSGTTTWTYDAAGRMEFMTRNDGSWLFHEYDVLGRLTGVANDQQARNYSYDWCEKGIGRFCAADYPDGTRHFGYTVDGQVSVTRDWTPSSDLWTGYAYDHAGRPSAILYAGGTHVGYHYTGAHLSSMTATINSVVQTVVSDVRYGPDGELKWLVYGHGLPKAREYDQNGRLTETHDYAFLRHQYTYNAADEVISIQNLARPQHSQDFSYDVLSRLTGVTSPSGSQGFTFDANGNRTSNSWYHNEIYNVDSLSNRLVASDIAFTYDGRGNRASQGWGGSSAIYQYDSFNRLSSVTRDVASTYTNPNYVTATYPAGTTTYTVNGLGQRVAKSGPLGNSRFVYGGQNTLLSEVTNGQGTDYLWLGNEPIGVVRGAQLYYVHADRLGRPEIVSHQDGHARWIAANYAYDRAVVGNSFGAYNLGLPGQYFDAETGHWYNGFRDYDGRTGRYLQSDPIGLAGGLNTYAYVRGNPISLIDPLGLVDRNYTPTWDGAHGGLALIPSPNGMLTVGVHFNGTNFISPSGQAWTPQQLADQIKADTDLSQYSSVGLYSCRTGAEGSDGTTPAQALANALGLPVQAPTQYTWVINNPIAPYQGNYGKTPAGGVDRSNPGSWINFYPVGP